MALFAGAPFTQADQVALDTAIGPGSTRWIRISGVVILAPTITSLLRAVPVVRVHRENSGPSAPGDLRELPVEVMAAAAHPALDKALDSALNAVPPVPCFPLLFGLGVDQRMSSSKSFTSVL